MIRYKIYLLINDLRRVPDLPNICVVTIFVADMETAKDFYETKLGFVMQKEYSKEIIQLQQEGIAVILQKCEINSDIQYGTQATTVIALQSLDIEKTIEEYKQKEIPLIFDTPQKCPPGYFTAIKDPFGNVLEVIQFD